MVVGLFIVVVGLSCEANVVDVTVVDVASATVLDVTVVADVSATGTVSVEVELLASLPALPQAEVMTRRPMKIERRGRAVTVRLRRVV